VPERKPPPLVPSPPAFSRRVWMENVFGLDNLPPEVANIVATEGLTIYVEAIRSTYEEDWEGEVYAWRDQRSFLSRCYSVVEPEGEIGFTPLRDVTPISEEEFRGATTRLRQNWPTRGPHGS
jgi:hypothetical protein